MIFDPLANKDVKCFAAVAASPDSNIHMPTIHANAQIWVIKGMKENTHYSPVSQTAKIPEDKIKPALLILIERLEGNTHSLTDLRVSGADRVLLYITMQCCT